MNPQASSHAKLGLGSAWGLPFFSVCLFNTIFPAPGLFCAELGECTDSIFLANVPADDSMDCLNKCQSHDKCNYGTFRPTDLFTNMCTFFQTCSRIETDSCPNCLTSSTKCSECLFSGLCSVSTYYLL